MLQWDRDDDLDSIGSNLYRGLSTNGPFVKVTAFPLTNRYYTDFDVTNGQRYCYKVRVVDSLGERRASRVVTAWPGAFRDNDAFLDYLQHTAVDYFWYESNPANGLIRDRSEPDSPCSIAAVGFGLTAMAIGVEHGWIPRAAARDRTLAALSTFWRGPEGTDRHGVIGYRGWFYHFLDMRRATRWRDSELSSIDTALLLAGVLDARQYFNRADSEEAAIR
ncbi:MAG: hypothetical protein KGS61_20510, partial [Verrucomicrobia bacterium]|nr:hypothetical protein [Verrucomicrobiota bacterium]